MKKIILLPFLFFITFTFASPVGNPLNPEIISDGFFISPASFINFRLGYEGNFVSDAKMNKKGGFGKIDNFQMDVNSGTFTLNLQNRTDVFAVLGASRIKTNWRFEDIGIQSRIEMESNYRIYWAAGGKIILFQWGNTALSTSGRYSNTQPSLLFVTLDGAIQDKDAMKIKYKDWQIDLGLAHQIDIFTPYVGGKYLKAQAKIHNAPVVITDGNFNYINMKNENNFGAYVGCTLSNSKYFLFTLEARFIDEDAISVMGEIKF
jgi:Chlamydia major outer membrane protein